MRLCKIENKIKIAVVGKQFAAARYREPLGLT